MSEVEFVHPEGLHFTCSRCGDCCRQWNIMLGPGELEHLQSLPWEASDPDLVNVSPGMPLSKGGPKRLVLTRRESGACLFLGEQNQCRIHERFGEAAKPLMCRMYPFGFSRVSERIAVEVSFACRAVSEDLGAPLAERTPEWSRLLTEPLRARSRFRFSEKHDVSGEVLWELEWHLVDLLSREGLKPVERVRAVLEFNRLATTSDPETEAARTLRRVMAEGIPRQIRERPVGSEWHRMDKTQRAVFFHLLFLMLNPTPSEILSSSRKDREREARTRVRLADAYKFPRGRPSVDNRELDTTFGRIAEISTEFLDGEKGAALAFRYLRAKVTGQRFLQEDEEAIGFVDAVPRLLLLYPMIVWTSKALAAAREQGAVSEEDVRRAIRLLDRSFGQIPLASLPSKARKAWKFVLLETDLPLTATLEMLDAYNAS